MAYYRQVYTSFWTDSKIEDDFTPEDRYFYLYLLTNAHTNLCGCYELSKKQMSNDTGYTVDVIERLLARMTDMHKVIRYNEPTKEVLLLNWHKYNWSNSDKLLKGVAKEIERVKCYEFQVILLQFIGLYGYATDTVSIGYQYPMDTSVSVSVTNTVPDTESINNNPTTTKTTDFDRFWDVYPKKVGKKDAQRSFERAKKTVLPEVMIRAVIAQKQGGQWLRDNGRYIPNPATWLNQGRWEDEIQPPDKAQKVKTAPSEQHTRTEDEWAELRRRAKA